MEPVLAAIALGSNLGDRKAAIQEALGAISRLPATRLLRTSDLIATAPEDSPPGAGEFLNSAVLVETSLTARQLLDAMLIIEQRLGRERTQRNAPRTIDLDLLLYGSDIIEEEGLQIPHPRMHERVFVLWPLLQIAPRIANPRTGEPYAAAFARIKGAGA
ncbi:MAG: 2-amino-4-hydroxy-6-hydroxymethyldihydropteridine diphosphokinase [Planctomycetes bacterium]|nr:2-amino-4-hydroxy-6-hydroxymethyldihydropteridine diphosphokinase [Planctomycetota bacterium]